jgi:hypothetical protein
MAAIKTPSIIASRSARDGAFHQLEARVSQARDR